MSDEPPALEGCDGEENDRRDPLSNLLQFGSNLEIKSNAGDVARAAEQIRRAIEGDLVPRLMLAFRLNEPRLDDDTLAKAEIGVIDQSDRDNFLAIALEDDGAAASTFVEALLQRGVSREAVYLDLFASTARSLGELWESDHIDFTAVTVGLMLLHRLIREQSSAYEPSQVRNRPGGKILLATACGDQHYLGVVIVGEFFRRAGWRVWFEPGASADEVAALSASERFDIIGLSAANSVNAGDVANEIEAVRAGSKNPDVKVFVGGRLFAENPELVEVTGADAWAQDAEEAVRIAESIVSVPART
ncbi:MAG: cobalamin B12-binding domain-containing protein [Pseudomonadota bacterium]